MDSETTGLSARARGSHASYSRLNPENRETDSQRHIKCCQCLHFKLIVLAACICLVLASSITALIAIPLKGQRVLQDRCHDVGPSSVAHVTQSGVYTVVGTLSVNNLTCYESFANVKLESCEDRSKFNVTLYLVNQNNLETSLLLFNNTRNDSEHHFNLGMINHARIFDDYYSQLFFGIKNYFLDANITLDIDISSISSSELFVCFYTDEDAYYSKFKAPIGIFQNSAKDCRSILLKSGERRNISEIFINDKPSFWYIGIAANVTVDVHRIWLRGVGHNISGIAQNASQPTTCVVDRSMNQKNTNCFRTMCTLSLDYEPANQYSVLVAYERDDPRRNYFATINVTLKSKDFSHSVRVYTIGIAASLSVIFLLVVILIIILLHVPCIKSKLQKRYPTQVTAEEREQSPDRSREGSMDRENASISSSRHCQINQRVQGNESNNVEQGNLSSPAPEREPQTSKTVEDYSTNLSFDIGHQALH